MMKLVLYNFLADVPRAATIWLGLVALALLVMVALVARPGRDRTGPPNYPEASDSTGRSGAVFRLSALAGPDDPTSGPAGAPTGSSTGALTAREVELRRYADEVTVAAERAATTAQRRREEWLAAQDAVDSAWQALKEADAAAARVASAAAFPLPRTPKTPAEYADRERYLHREAMAACCRSELSVLELSDALAHRNGWDPRLHPVQQELMLRRAARDTRRAAHQAVLEREREAWRTSELSVTAARSLRQEAFAAAWRADRFRHVPDPARLPARPVGRSGAVARWRTARAS